MNRKTLGWTIVCAIATIVAVVWSIFTYYHPADSSKQPSYKTGIASSTNTQVMISSPGSTQFQFNGPVEISPTNYPQIKYSIITRNQKTSDGYRSDFLITLIAEEDLTVQENSKALVERIVREAQLGQCQINSPPNANGMDSSYPGRSTFEVNISCVSQMQITNDGNLFSLR